MEFEPVIGLEVHAQLLTRTKLFCGCSTAFGAEPNAATCPVCLGLPGALPVANREAVAMAVRAALALGCRINARSIFARKNYFYPDLPKGYQISQYDRPLGEQGRVEVFSGERTPAGNIVNRRKKVFHITRLHMEEDAGKSVHEGLADSDAKSYVNLNRSGVPLTVIVSRPVCGMKHAAARRRCGRRRRRTITAISPSRTCRRCCSTPRGSRRRGCGSRSCRARRSSASRRATD